MPKRYVRLEHPPQSKGGLVANVLKKQMADAPRIGDVLLVRLPRHTPSGHEQEGLRLIIVVGEPDEVGAPRFPQIIVVPLTSQVGKWSRNNALYPHLQAGVGGLTQDSVLLEHVRAVDAKRVVRRLGRLSAEDYLPVKQGLAAIFKLN